jgi:nitrite reductase/ring-hydroxylating ferredoxin subunit
MGQVVTATWVPREATAAQPGPAVIKLKPGDYPSLQGNGGSVQLEFSSAIPPITINRETETLFHAFDSICTHAGCTVGKFVQASGLMRCDCHGSRYDIRGKVLFGPAQNDLKSHPADYDPSSGTLEIRVPGLGLQIESMELQGPAVGGELLKLAFHSTAYTSYRLYHFPTLGAEPVVVPFSTSPGGPFSQTTLMSTTDRTSHVYITTAATRGFYAISLHLTEFVP